MSIEKTNALKRIEVPINLLVGNALNPNKMSDAEFNLLYNNMEQIGFVDPLFVRQDPKTQEYRVIGGHHRLEVAKLLGYDQVPCTIIDDPEFDEDQEKFQMVRMNVIRGRMTPDKFLKLYQSLEGKYSDDIMSDMFGFAEEEDFQKLIKSVEKDLPKELQKEFKEAAKEIKTIDGLTNLLNRMFTLYGDTLPYGMMIMDFGGQDSVWLRMTPATKKSIPGLAEVLRKHGRTADDILGMVVQLIAQNDPRIQEVVDHAVKNSKPVELPDGYDQLPTFETLPKVA